MPTLREHCACHTDSRFGPSKRVKIVSKIVTFANMVSGPVLGRFFIDFGAHFGSLLAPKWLKKAIQKMIGFWDAKEIEVTDILGRPGGITGCPGRI